MPSKAYQKVYRIVYFKTEEHSVPVRTYWFNRFFFTLVYENFIMFIATDYILSCWDFILFLVNDSQTSMH